jgi:hypothetical protein
MTPEQRDHKKQQKAKERQKRKDQQRVKQEQQQAQAALKIREKAGADLHLEKHWEQVLMRKLQTQRKLLRKIFALRFPPCLGCTNYQEICRVLAWDKHVPGEIRRVLPTRKWLEQFRKSSVDILSMLGLRIPPMSKATQSRWQWPWVVDDRVFKK